MSAVELARELVRMPSTPDGGQPAIADLLANRLQDKGFDVALDRYADGHVNVVARWGDPALSAVCLTGHLDTVSVAESAWTVDPWGAAVVDGRLYGRGSADMKGGVAALVRAAEEHVADPPPGAAPVALLLTAQEEVGSLGAASLARAGLLPDAHVLVVAEPTSNLPVLGHRGVVWLDVVARGRSCHGSTPHLGENAVEKLMTALAAVRAWMAEHGRDDGADHPVLGARTLNIGQVHGGILRNIVPDVARAELDVRTPDPADADRLAPALAALVAGTAEVEPVLTLPRVWTEPEDPWVAAVREAAAARGDVPEPLGAARFFTDAAVLTPALGGVPTVVCGPGSPDQAHVVDEWCDARQVEAAVGIYREVLSRATRLIGSS